MNICLDLWFITKVVSEKTGCHPRITSKQASKNLRPWCSLISYPEVTANTNCKSRNLPNTDCKITVKICGSFWVTQYMHFLSCEWDTKIKSRSILFSKYCMPKKSWPNLFCNLLYKMGQRILRHIVMAKLTLN